MAGEGHAPQGLLQQLSASLGGGERKKPPLGPPKMLWGVTPGISSPSQPPFEQLWLIGVKNESTRLWPFLLITESPSRPSAFRPPLARGGGLSAGTSLCGAGPGQCCLPGGLGGHPAHLLLLHLPPPPPPRFFPRQEGEEAARSPPAAPFPPPVAEQREAGRQSSGSRWASPCRLPALPANGSPLPQRCRSSGALPGSRPPHPGRAAGGSPPSRPHVPALRAKCCVVTCS